MSSTKTEGSTGRIVEALEIGLAYAQRAVSRYEVHPSSSDAGIIESALAEARAAPAAEPVVRIIREKDGSLTAKWGPGYVPTEGDRLFLAPPPVEASGERSVYREHMRSEVRKDMEPFHRVLGLGKPASQQQASGDARIAELNHRLLRRARIVSDQKAELSRLTADLSAAKAEAEANAAENAALRKDALAGRIALKWLEENQDSPDPSANCFGLMRLLSNIAALASQGSQRSENRNEGEKE